MSININVNGMNYMGTNYAERSEREQRCKNRLLKVREQSKEMAQDLRDKVRIAKQEELKKIQKIKEKELSEWKRRRQCQIETQIDCGLRDFANAHIAALEASCEEGESLREEKEEQDLMAACRGRVAMLQEQRKREKEAEERLLKKKRKHQKTIGIQADFLAQHAFKEKVTNNRNIHIDLANLNSESEEENIPRFTSKPNVHKHQTDYNPQNYTSNSVDSSNGSESGNEEIQVDNIQKEESELEFDQITNLLKQRMQEIYDAPMKKIAQAKAAVEISSESSSDIEIVEVSKVKKTPTKVSKKLTAESKKATQKGILKTNKSPSKVKATTSTKKTTSPKKLKAKPAEANRVHYVDFTNNKYQSTYVPPSDLVTRNEPRNLNAREEAQIHINANDPASFKINEDVLRQLNEIRSYEALQKEKIRRDYDRLRLEMDELSKQEQEIRSKSNVNRPVSRDQLLRKEENRQKKMNEAVENALKKNVITCPPVARENVRSQSSDVNVAATNPRLNEEKNSEINNLVKIERLKDLLEKINHQKRLILNEIEKRDDDVPGPDLERVMECLDKLEKEKASLDAENKEKLKKFNELSERERKVKEREIRLESNLRDLFKKQQQKETQQSTSSSLSPPTTSSESSSDCQKIIAPPVEIIIKVQHPTKSPRKKSKKSIRCLDTLSRVPGKIYPKTPIKRKSRVTSDEQLFEQVKAKTVTSEASKEPSKSSDHPAPSSTLNQARSILKKSQPSDESSSTSYRSLPEAIPHTSQPKSHHKLNPALMHYITRLLGMSTNIGNQLNVDVSSVTTPGSSTINTSGNNSAIIVEPAFDVNRMAKLQQFIDDNYSFLDEINETLESVEQDQINEKRMEGIWRDVLNKKKPQSVPSGSKVKSTVRDSQGIRDTSHSKGIQSSQASKSTIRPASNRLPSNKIIEASTSKGPKSTTSTAPKIIEKEPTVKILRPTNQPTSIRSVPSKNPDTNVLNNYAEYTANCQRKIADLTRMMEKVRQEKLKLIENSLSSNEYNNFTEYREILQVQDGKSSDQKDSPSQKEDPPSEEINNILQRQTRPFGVSKDSGISGSRPLTSSDYRDSPDARVTSEEANVFQPINKAPKVRIITPDGEHETVKDLSQVIRLQQKAHRPPLSLKSFSPQIEKQHEPHELSTIAEIETPTASKTIIVPDDDNNGVSNLHSFPDFDQYAQDIGEHHFVIQQTFPELGDLQNALPDIHIETFVNPHDYNLDEISKNEEEVASNNSSLMDIMEEMKKRRIIDKSFETIDETSNAIMNKTPTTTIKINQPQSPRRPPPQSRVIIKTPENPEGNIQIEIQHTPTKRKQASSNVPPPESPSSNDTLSGIQEIERDLKGAGLSWAAKLLKRSEEAKKQQQKSSSSSDNIEIEFDVRSSSSDGTGKPMDLKEFLRRELKTKSINDKYLSDDTSWSSQFMRSLLNASSGTSNSNPKSTSSQNGKLRTSTPVDMKSTTKITDAGKTATSSKQLFLNPGADSVSTVRDSGASGSDKSDRN